MKDRDFFEKNDVKVNDKVTYTLMFVLAVVPLVALFRATGLFSLSFIGLLQFSVVCLLGTVSPRILYKLGVRADFVKYYTVTCVSIIVAMMATQPHVGIYITYILAVILSLFYADKYLTLYAEILGYVLLMTALYFREAALIAENPTDTVIHAYFAYGIGFTLEFAIVCPLFLGIVKSVRNHYERENRLIDEIRNEDDRFRLSLENAKDVVFEYDIIHDTLKYYGGLLDDDDFGSHKPNFIENLKDTIVSKKLALPEDALNLSNFIENDLNGKLQLRVLRKGEPYWLEIEGHIFYEGNVQVRAIGKIKDINAEKLEEERKLLEGEGSDQLTGFYERSAGIRIIRRYRNEAVSGFHFFVYFFFDSAEAIRKKAGSVFCDAIIRRISEIITSQMRSTDVAVRFSSDEFIIYFQDRTPAMIDQTIDILNEQIRAIYVGEGIAEFIETTFKVYERIQDLEADALNSDLIKDIEVHDDYSDDVISFAFSQLEHSTDIDESINLILERIGRRYSLDFARVLSESQIPGLQYCINEYCDLRGMITPMYGETISVQRMKKIPSLYICDKKELGSDSLYIIFQGSGLEGDFRESICSKLREASHIINAYINKDKAESASKSKTDFLSSMSHEIRTPMNAIAGFAELVLQEETSDTVMEYANNILGSTQNLLGVVNDILDISKIESGKFEIILVQYYLHDIINEITSLMTIQLGKKPVSYILNVDKNVPDGLIGDNVRIRQVLINLLNNAIKFTQIGSISLNVSWEDRSDGDGNLTISVKDTGMGIKESELDNLFVPFVQADTKKNHGIVGTGLGLAITKQLVEMMGGTIEVSSVYGEGTEFVIELPQDTFDLSPYEYINGKVRRKRKAFVIPFTTIDTRVLVVDDNHVNREVAKGLLSKYQIEVVDVPSGREALSLLDSDSNFDIIFMDHLMPDMDGIECTLMIRNSEDAKLQEIPIIALTANAIKGVEKSFEEAGMNGFLPKPINLKELCNILDNILPNEKKIYINPEDEK